MTRPRSARVAFSFGVLVLFACAAPAYAGASVSKTKTRFFGVRPMVVVLSKDVPLEVGAAGDVTLIQGSFAPRVGASFAVTPSGRAGGHLRLEGNLDYLLGPLYLGIGGSAGTLAVDTPGVGSGAWTGAAIDVHGHLGARVGLATALTAELRGGHTLPIGSIDPTEPVPDQAARFELTASVGMAF